MTTAEDLPQLPFARTRPLDLAPIQRLLLAERPVTRVRTPAGDEAWLVTGYPEAKVLLSDGRLGRSHPDPERAPKISQSAVFGGPTDNHDTERDDHQRMRRLLAPAFSARRVRTLRDRIQELTDDRLDALAAGPRPTDLHEALSYPLPVLVICELLGVPAEDRSMFRAWTEGITDQRNGQRSRESLAALVAYVGTLVEPKRRSPGEDLISDLVRAELGDEEISGLAAVLLFAGHETTVTRIDFGALLLLTNPDQHEAVRRDPELIPAAVEEVLRAVPPGGNGGVPRYAQADMEVGGVQIRAGEAVLLGLGVANRDGREFPDADRFDVHRKPNTHLAFGHGAHYCVGASLARAELQVVLGSLIGRFPGLRLAVPLDELRLRPDRLGSALETLPVTW